MKLAEYDNSCDHVNDEDGIGNNEDTDDDGDGVSDAEDYDSLDSNVWEEPGFSLGFLQLIGILVAIALIMELTKRKEEDAK